MARTFRSSATVLCFLALFFSLATCSKQAPSNQSQSLAQRNEENPTSAQPSGTPAQNVQPQLIVADYVSGDVQASKLSNWDPVETGMSLERSQSVKTGAASECELQFGKIAVVRIQEKTVIELKTVSLGDRSRVALDLGQGAVLCKVRKLATGESFRVRTETAVGGVRGTEFRMSVSGDKSTVVAVKEGAVAILPVSADVNAAEQAADQGVSAVDDMLDKIQASAPVITSGQQISYTPQAAAKSSATLEGMGDVVQKIIEESRNNQQVSTQTLQKVDQLVQKAAPTLPTAAGAPIAISPQGAQSMKPLDTMEIRENSQAPAISPPSPQSQVTPPVPVKRPLQPIESRITASKRALVGQVLSSGQTLVAVDASGVLVATTREGKVVWTVRTANAPNENTPPVVAGTNVYFSGAKEFVIVRLATGAIVSRTPLDSTSAHLFGQRVLVASSLGLFPAAASIRVFDPATGRTARDITIPGGSLMTPAVADGKILTVNQTGALLIVDPATGSIDTQIPTGATQPVALSVSLKGQSAFFADRKGLVVAVDLSNKQLLWSTQLPGTGSGGVFQDLAITDAGVYAFSRNTLFAFSITDGKPLFDPIPEVTTPPLISGGKLYIGSATRKLLVLDPATGKTISTLDIGGKLVTRPSVDGNRIIAGTDSGQIIIIDPSALQ